MTMQLSRREVLGAGGIVAVVALTAPIRVGARDAGHFSVSKSSAEWRKELGPSRYAILREAATEPPFSSPLDREHRSGTYDCAGCAQPLYSSSTKFDSGTGWPSFFRPLSGAIVTRPDHKLFIERTEVLCSRCGGHLGHVFNDGPKPTGLRYCMNGLALRFIPA